MGEFCALCEVEAAAWRCAECTLAFCDGCREQTHSLASEDTAGHTLSLVGDGSEMMAQMERRAEAQALRANEEEQEMSQAVGVDPEPLLSEGSVLWVSAAAGIAARIDVLPGGACSSDGNIAETLRVVPDLCQAGDQEQADALGAWAKSSSPLLQDGKAPILVLDDAQSFALPLAAVVYFCVEEPGPEETKSVEQRQTPVAPDPAGNCSPAAANVAPEHIDSVVGGIEDLALEGVAHADRSVRIGATVLAQGRLQQRRPLGVGEAMVHIVLLEMEWDRSLTLRLLLGKKQASAVGSLINAAVQTSVGEDRQRPRAKHALAKWLLARRDVVPPDNACEQAGIMLEEELGGWVTVPPGQKIVVGKRRRKCLSTSSLSASATGRVEARAAGAGGSTVDNESSGVQVGNADSGTANFNAARRRQANRAELLHMQDRYLAGPGVIGRLGHEHENLDEYAHSASIFARVLSRSRIFKDSASLAAVHALLPCHQQVNEWELLFCNHTHGSSLATFSRLCAHKGSNLIIIEDTSGAIFGGYASVAWRAAAGSDGNFFGTGQSFLWRIVRSNGSRSATDLSSVGSADSPHGLRVSAEQYRWTKATRGQFMRISEDSLAMGGSDEIGTYGLWLDHAFEYGTTGRCDTFGNPPLLQLGDRCSDDSTHACASAATNSHAASEVVRFRCRNFECWLVDIM